MNKDSKKAKLVLKDGTIIKGKLLGAKTSVSGEVVFNTGLVGYPQTLTDPSYRGQILVLTYPLIGNYGVPKKSIENNLLKYFESDKIHIKGLIISDYSFRYNHWNAANSLNDWLKENNIPALYNVDTRELTKKLRDKGVMPGNIIVDKTIEFEDINQKNLVKEVSISAPITYKKGKISVVLIDCGVKNSIIRSFLKRDITVIRVPWDYEIEDLDYDGLFISNGPGNPKVYTKTVKTIKMTLKNNKPIFGICLGNQLLSLAAGADTYKLKYGHRSQNQPCIEVGTKKCFITSQNHGFAVNYDTLPKDWKLWFKNLNDDSCEGVKHKSKPFFSVQFHPEANPGPTDTEFLFDKFLEEIKRQKEKI